MEDVGSPANLTHQPGLAPPQERSLTRRHDLDDLKIIASLKRRASRPNDTLDSERKGPGDGGLIEGDSQLERGGQAIDHSVKWLDSMDLKS